MYHGTNHTVHPRHVSRPKRLSPSKWGCFLAEPPLVPPPTVRGVRGGHLVRREPTRSRKRLYSSSSRIQDETQTQATAKISLQVSQHLAFPSPPRYEGESTVAGKPPTAFCCNARKNKKKLTWLTARPAGRAKNSGTPDHLQEKHNQQQEGHVACRDHGVVRTDGLRDRGVLVPGEADALVDQDPPHHWQQYRRNEARSQPADNKTHGVEPRRRNFSVARLGPFRGVRVLAVGRTQIITIVVVVAISWFLSRSCERCGRHRRGSLACANHVKQV